MTNMYKTPLLINDRECLAWQQIGRAQNANRPSLLYRDSAIQEFIPVQCLEWAKKYNSQINLPFNVLTHKYFFHDNPTLNINYLEQVLVVPTHGKKYQAKKESEKNGIGNDQFGIDQFDVEFESTKWN